MLMAEPRGHADMYGAVLVEPDLPGADLAVLFLHNEGYSTMCGHAVIALGRFAVERGLVPACEPETEVRIQCPCGLVVATVEVAGGRAGRVRFASVPAFAFARDAVAVTGPFGPVTLDVGYGGAFYGVLPASQVGLDLERSPVSRLVEAAMAIKQAAAAQIPLSHPDSPDLAYLYGVILTDDMSADPQAATTNVCVFADGQVDRSPTGSGVTARLALMHRRGQVATGASRRFRSITGGEFAGRVLCDHPGRPASRSRGRGRRRGILHRRGDFLARARRPSRRRLSPAAVTVPSPPATHRDRDVGNWTADCAQRPVLRPSNRYRLCAGLAARGAMTNTL